MTSLPATLAILAALPFMQAATDGDARDDADPPILSELADRYCIGPDGDHRLTWHLAEQDGFTWLTADQFPNLRLLSAAGNNLRGLEKTIDGVQIRVLTSALSWTAPYDGHSFFRLCWISSSRYDSDQAEREMDALLGVRRFKSQNTWIYAWIPRVDGRRSAINRRTYRRQHLTLAREQGLREVTLQPYRGAVFIGYHSPRDRETYRLFDWAGPEPVAATE